MPFNVLLLPLLGGYVFITNWNKTRFDAKRYTGERLIFHAALAGVVFVITGFIVVRLVEVLWPGLHTFWTDAIPFPFAGTSLIALGLGSTLWALLNQLPRYDRTKQVQQTIEDWNDYLEILLKRSLEEVRHVLVTLKTGKVYVGFVTYSFDPAYDRKYIVLLPR